MALPKLPKLSNPFAKKTTESTGTAVLDRWDRARETARSAAHTLFVDGYRVATAHRRISPNRFFADRMAEVQGDEYLIGYMDVFRPDQLRAPNPKPAYLVATILNAETGYVRYVCSCEFWRREWYASASKPNVSWCKHTAGIELLVAAALPISDLLRSLASSQIAPSDSSGQSDTARFQREGWRRSDGAARLMTAGVMPGDGYGSRWSDLDIWGKGTAR